MEMANKPAEQISPACSDPDSDTVTEGSSAVLLGSDNENMSENKKNLLESLESASSDEDESNAVIWQVDHKQITQQKIKEEQERKCSLYPSTKEFQITNILKQFIMEKKFTDLTIFIRNFKFECHRMIFAMHSKSFAEIFEGKSELRISSKNITPRAFHLLYRWAISDIKPGEQISNKELVELLQAARVLDMPQLEEDCWGVLEVVCQAEDYAFDLYVESSKRSLSDVAEACINTITTYFLPILGTKEYLNMPKEGVVRLIISKRIAVHNELQVFMGACIWLLHDWDNRAQHTKKFMKYINFTEIDKNLLFNLRFGDCESLQPIMDIPGVQEMVDDAFAERVKQISKSPEKDPMPSRTLFEEDNYWRTLKEPQNKKTFFDIFKKQVEKFDHHYWKTLKLVDLTDEKDSAKGVVPTKEVEPIKGENPTKE